VFFTGHLRVICEMSEQSRDIKQGVMKQPPMGKPLRSRALVIKV